MNSRILSSIFVGDLKMSQLSLAKNHKNDIKLSDYKFEMMVDLFWNWYRTFLRTPYHPCSTEPLRVIICRKIESEHLLWSERETWLRTWKRLSSALDQTAISFPDGKDQVRYALINMERMRDIGQLGINTSPKSYAWWPKPKAQYRLIPFTFMTLDNRNYVWNQNWNLL